MKVYDIGLNKSYTNMFTLSNYGILSVMNNWDNDTMVQPGCNYNWCMSHYDNLDLLHYDADDMLTL